MCNPSLADSLPSPPTSSSYSKNHYFSDRLRRPSLRSMAGAGPTQGHGSSPSSVEDRPRHFLDSCFLCRTRIHVGDDIYMYRGDTPFCSEECRQEQILMDEAEERDRKKKKTILSKKKLATSKINSGDDSAYKSREIRVSAAAGFNVSVAV